MSDADFLPVPHSATKDIDKLYSRNNELELDGQRLRELAEHVKAEGLTVEQLLEIYNGNLVVNNPLLSHIIAYSGMRVQEASKDMRSFNRGAALAYHLIDGASIEGAPIMGIGSYQIAYRCQSQPETLEALRLATDELMDSQENFNLAFDDASEGLPSGTDHEIARFGGGTVLLGLIIAHRLGGSGVEAWFEPNQ